MAVYFLIIITLYHYTDLPSNHLTNSYIMTISYHKLHTYYNNYTYTYSILTP